MLQKYETFIRKVVHSQELDLLFTHLNSSLLNCATIQYIFIKPLYDMYCEYCCSRYLY